MKWMISCAAICCMFSCSEQKKSSNPVAAVDSVATAYVRLGLLVGQYDGDFVDAYYGPDSLKPVTVKLAVFPKDSLLNTVQQLRTSLGKILAVPVADSIKNRVLWIDRQLIAFSRRIKIFSGEYQDFDAESKELFGGAAPVYNEAHYATLLQELDSMLPGKGTVAERFHRLAKEFILPKDKMDTVFKTAIAEARKRTLAHFSIPSNENFTLEYVTGKSWSGYNWYKGNYQSLIQISSDLDIYIERAIDLACHEGYPGHHAYNSLLEKNLYRDKGWVEVSLYPLFSPQSLVAEGSANYGIAVAFPGKERNTFLQDVLMPLAGLDTTHAAIYFAALDAKAKLDFARNEAGRGLINGTMQESEALAWLKKYCLMNDETAGKSIRFIKNYRAYIINYNYGQQVVSDYINANGGNENAEKRWEVFGHLLSNQLVMDN
jgi:hypothetical protein